MKPITTTRDIKATQKPLPGQFVKFQDAETSSINDLKVHGGVCCMLSREALLLYATFIQDLEHLEVVRRLPEVYELFASVAGPLLSPDEICHGGLTKCKLHKLKEGTKPDKLMFFKEHNLMTAFKPMTLEKVPIIQGYFNRGQTVSGKPEDLFKHINLKHDYEYTLYFAQRTFLTDKTEGDKRQSGEQASSRVRLTLR